MAKVLKKSSRVLPSVFGLCFSGGLHLKDLREHFGADWEPQQREGDFLILKALWWDDGRTALFITDDDDFWWDLDEGKTLLAVREDDEQHRLSALVFDLRQ